MDTRNYPREIVELVQTALHFQNFAVSIDGVWGPKTEAAYQAYVAANTPKAAFKYRIDLDSCETTLVTGQKYDLKLCLANWEKNRARYDAVSTVVDLPSRLIAALHWREASGNFGLYLQQGDKLGTVTYANGRSNKGKSLPLGPGMILFAPGEWNEAAVLALRDKAHLQTQLRITRNTTSLDLLCEYAENYNGLGYRRRNLPSPYVLAGTSGYDRGKFIADSVYDPNAIDFQLGVLPILRALA